MSPSDSFLVFVDNDSGFYFCGCQQGWKKVVLIVDIIVSIFEGICKAIITAFNIFIMVFLKVWTFSCDFFGGGWIGPVITLGWMLFGGLFVGAVLFTFSINRTQSSIELFSASTMKTFLGAFVVAIIFIFLWYITSQPT